MSITHVLFQIFIEPLVLLFEALYKLSMDFTGDSAFAIIPLSVAVNFLCLPLYLRADAIKSENQSQEKKMEPWLCRIKEAFTGDERFMMIKAYYRVSHYKPIYALRNSVPLFLQIPFFMAAYRVLSHASYLQGKSFGPIADLGAPDGLLAVGNVTINILPVIMTLINALSSTVYSRNSSRKDKIQLYAVALIFLILLYNSASGLVFYWILNQVFSLCKNIYLTFDNRKILQNTIRKAKKRKIGELQKDKNNCDPDFKLYLTGSLVLTILTGVLIPSALVVSSPSEFIDVWDFHSPLRHIVDSFLAAAGLFLVWSGVSYYLSANKVRKVFEYFVCVVSVASVMTYMFFGTDLGDISGFMKFNSAPFFPSEEKLLNAELIVLAALVVLLVWLKKKPAIRTVQSMMLLVLVGMAGLNVYHIQRNLPQLNRVVNQITDEKAEFEFSKDGKNVVVIMLDRAMSGYVPYIFQEKPELYEQFDGFTYYPNTISYGSATNVGSPGLYGGYEYIPEEMNKRDDVLLGDKQNEALKLMPVLFDEAGYDVTVCDPVYAGYSDIPDLSIYDEYPGIKTYMNEYGQYRDQTCLSAHKREFWSRNFFMYSMMKISPLLWQSWLYDNGIYLSQTDVTFEVEQIMKNKSEAKGFDNNFLNTSAALSALPEMSAISNGSDDTFLMFYSSATHDPALLSEPDYEAGMNINNSGYDENLNRFTYNGRTAIVESLFPMAYYHINMATLSKLGTWLDYLREEGVYDNTRIIIVSDHGLGLRSFQDMVFGPRTIDDAMWYNVLLMVKDFDSEGAFSTDNSFMTNADTPTLAFEGLINDPVNPFTGNRITDKKKYEDEHHIFYTHHWHISANNGTTFLPGDWFSLHGDNLFDMDAWEYLGNY